MNEFSVLTVFFVTYAGIALGRFPGLALDRTGIALLGAITMVVGGALPLSKAVRSIDVPTILLLYSLMVVSAQLRLGGFYTRTARLLTELVARPRIFLAGTMLLSATLSALLANDIICLAFTPVMAVAVVQAKRNPLPFLLGLAVSSNIGSAATIIGNPQNMLIGQVGKLDFASFLFWCLPPVAVSLAGAYLVLLRMYRGAGFDSCPGGDAVLSPDSISVPAFDRWQSAKGVGAVLVILLLFFTPIPREFSALSVAGLLLCSRRMKSRRILGLIDWHLITLFCALFVVIEAVAALDLFARGLHFLNLFGISPQHPFALAVISVVLSNTVSNVPATLLLTKFLIGHPPELWYILALSSTFAGNLLVIGSIANLIVIEQAGAIGIRISFRDHARVGIPVTLLSLGIMGVWILLRSATL